MPPNASSGLFERYQPDVVVTYDELGGYDHPDHVHASRVAMAAVARTGIPRKAYFTAFRRSMFERFRAVLEEQGADLSQFPQPDPEQLRMMDAVEARITTAIDVGPFVERKRTALATHASQIEESFWARLPTEAFGALFGEEAFIRAHDTTGGRSRRRTSSSGCADQPDVARWRKRERYSWGDVPTRR